MMTNLLSFFKSALGLSLWLILLGWSELAYGQSLPNIVNVDLKVDVSFNPANQVFSYNYTIVSGPENLGEISLLVVDILTEATLVPTSDPDLVSDGSFRLGNGVPTRSVPVGVQSPPGWISGISDDGRVIWGVGFSSTKVAPGTSLSGFVITSKAPPGPRDFEMRPLLPFTDSNIFPEDCEIRPDCRTPASFTIKGQTIGPVLPEELEVVRGNLNIERAEVRVELVGVSNSRFEVRGSFVVGTNSDGIDVLNEVVTVTFDGFSETISAGSFFRDDDDEGFQFDGAPGGIKQINIRDDGEIRVKARDLELSGIDLNNPVPFSLQIGNDLGETGIPFDDDGRFEQE